VHAALREVRLDEMGDVVLDNEALSALQAAFASMPRGLTTEQLGQMQHTIRTGLPGRAGEQTAKIVANYHTYHLAQQRLKTDRGDEAMDPAAALVQLEELAALRRQYLGYEAANKLFGQEEAYARYTLESMRVQSLEDLPQAQKDAMQAQLKSRLATGVLPDKPSAAQTEWQHRHEIYQRERQLIMNAGLSAADEIEQVESLLRSHFRPEEIERARNYIPGSH
jgi:lipase chaperone LimK